MVQPCLASSRHRALELDAVAFGIVQVDRRALALGAVARRLLSAADAVRHQMRDDRSGVERRDPQAQMIEIGAAAARPALCRSGLVGRNDIDQRLTRAQLRELALALLERACLLYTSDAADE